MELHRLVAQLIAARGRDVVSDPAEFRAALDDFLTDDEVSIGDANVLVDAVRLDAVRRLEALLAGGSDARSAVNEAGLTLARDRGSDDAARSVRAVAVLGFALGLVDEGVVREQGPASIERPAAPLPATTAPPAMPPPPPPPPPVPPQPTSMPSSLPTSLPTSTEVLQASSFPPPHAEPGGGGSTLKILAVVGVVLVVAVAGFVGWRLFWPRTGAESPEEAVQKLLTGIEEQDVIGVGKMLNPGEIEGLEDLYDAARERAEDEDLIDGDDGITDALSIEFDNLDFEVEELGDDMARVTVVDGDYVATFTPARLPERLRDIGESDGGSEEGELADGDDVHLMTVKVDGRWYVTLLGTVADYVYQEVEEDAGIEDLAEPDWDLASEDVDPITGEDPEDVIENLVDAVNSGDAEDVLASLPEDLVRPLRPYIPVVESLQDEGGWGEDIGLSVTADHLDLSTDDLDDGKVKVTIESGVFSGTTWDDGYASTGTAEIDGNCISADEGYGPNETCIDDGSYADELGIDEFFFVVSEEGDGYQLDPIATLVEYATTAVDNFTGDVVDRLIEELESEF